MENDILRRLLWAGPAGSDRGAGERRSRTASPRPSGCGCSRRTRRSEHSRARRPRRPAPPARTRPLGELVIDVSERISTLIREEIELAKTEVREKVQKLLQGSVVGIAAGVFVLMALAMFMHGIAWLLNDLFFSGDV